MVVGFATLAAVMGAVGFRLPPSKGCSDVSLMIGSSLEVLTVSFTVSY